MNRPESNRRWLRNVLRTLAALLRGEPDVVIRFAGPMLVAGLALVFAAGKLDGFGVITAVFAVSFGAAGGTFFQWRSERGLWMLAGLFLVVNAGIYAMFIYGRFQDFVRGARPASPDVLIDFSFGTLLVSSMIQFLWRVAKYNWTISREPENS